MKDFLRKNGIRMGIIALALVFAIGINIAAGDGSIAFLHKVTEAVEAPVKKVLSTGVGWFNTIYGYLYEYDCILAENESLRSQLADAQASAREGVEASAENVRLRRLLELYEEHGDYVFESSKVVLWDADKFSHSFTISKGTNCGIQLGNPVITEEGVVVGQITSVSEFEATVSTIIDVDMSVGAVIEETGTTGMVIGEYSFMKKRISKLSYMPEGSQLFVGAEVVTSGSGGAFPRGLLIGKVTAVQQEAGGQDEYGIVEPACDFDALVQVFVIKNFASRRQQ